MITRIAGSAALRAPVNAASDTSLPCTQQGPEPSQKGCDRGLVKWVAIQALNPGQAEASFWGALQLGLRKDRPALNT